MADAFIGLGANLGDRRAAISDAIESLRPLSDLAPLDHSSVIETAPVGPIDQPDYLNAVAWLRTSIKPSPLLVELLKIERDAGRVRDVRWGPRTLDLDLLLYDDQIIDAPDLKVPHPRMHERRFVLEPLCELDGERVHPTLSVNFNTLLDRLSE